MLSLAAWRQMARERLVATDDPDYELSLLIEAATGLSRAQQRLREDFPLSPAAATQLDDWLQRRADGEPLAYLLGRQPFYDIELQVDRTTLIPRPDTEILVEAALTLLPQHGRQRIADLGTGSGAIAVAVGKHRPRCLLFAVDKQPQALTLARRNAAANGVHNVLFLCADWLQPFAEAGLDMILANPPYIAADDPHLATLRHEPQSALVAQKDGYADLLTILAQAERVLKPGGFLLMEHGWQQGARLRAAARERGKWWEIRTLHDYGGRERVFSTTKIS